MKKKIYILVLVFIMINSLLINSFAGTSSFDDTPEYKGIEIINPDQDVIYSDYLLISLKIKEQCKFNLSIYSDIKEEEKSNIEIFQVVSDSAIKVSDTKVDTKVDVLEGKKDYICIYAPVTITSSEKFKFHSIQLEKLSPGSYYIVIEVLDKDGKVTHINKKEFSIKSKELRPEIKVDDSKSPSLKSLSNIIKSLFKN